MTLLQHEQGHINEQFNIQWTNWKNDHDVTLSFHQRDASRVWDHFPMILYEYFPDASMYAARQVGLAAAAASLYSSLLQQETADALPPHQVLKACHWLQDFSRRQLVNVIPSHLPFWQWFSKAYQECRESFAQEHLFLSLPLQNYTKARFNEIIRGKSILSHVTLHAFTHLSNHEVVWDALVESQRHLYTGLRLHQDVLNWRADYISGAFSYTLNVLLEALSFTPATDVSGRQAQSTEIGRYFYYTGLAEQMLANASDHFCRAIAGVTDLPSTSWRALLASLLEQSERLRKDIEQIRHRQTDNRGGRETQLYNNTESPESFSPSHIHMAMEGAARYLLQEQEADGHWGDFLLSAEQSTFWVTSYVAWIFAQTQRPEVKLPRTARWLLDHQFPGGGWGYNSNWPLDADTITHALLFLSSQVQEHAAEWTQALDVLLTCQRPDGGFSTMQNAEDWLLRFPSETEDLSGWTSSHPCVTAVVALLLTDLDNGSYRPQAEKALAYLRACQNADGYWNAYWWSGQLYTTSRTMQAMHAMGDPQNASHMARATAWLISSQLADGGWATSDRVVGQPFHTALAVQALCLCVTDDTQMKALARGVQWLLTHQLSTGSWQDTPIMLLPSPDILDPWKRTNWTESILGLNVIISDWRRVFTTATVLQALKAVVVQSPFALVD